MRFFTKVAIISKLYYRHSPMNAGKSTALLQVAHNYEERGQTVIIAKPSVDTKGDNKIVSRLGITRTVDFTISPELNVLTAIKLIEKGYNLESKGKRIDCLIIDEAQFLTKIQVDQLFYIAVELNIPVLAYGIRTDFQSNAFTGSARLLEIAHSLEELKTICRCGKKAMFNGRKVDGRFILEGDQVAIDGDVEYESLCGKCYIEKVGRFSN